MPSNKNSPPKEKPFIVLVPKQKEPVEIEVVLPDNNGLYPK